MAADESQNTLRELWLGGKEGSLCGREQARVWALREQWRDADKPEYGMMSYIASKVRTTKKGRPTGRHPDRSAIRKLLEKIDGDDEEWFPGKFNNEESMGRKRVLTGPKLHAVCKSAKTVKGEVGDVTFPLVAARAATALTNPDTGKLVDKKAFYTAIRENCTDEGADDTWDNLTRSHQQPLTEDQILKRHAFGQYMQGLGHTADYYYERLVWTDICNTIVARSAQKAAEQALSRKGKKGWMSKSKKNKNYNLRGDDKALKLNSWGTVKVYWAPVVTRGKLHIVFLGSGFPGESTEGVEVLVPKVKTALNIRFQGASAPNMLFVDRGCGFYDIKTGRITAEYKAALRANGLRAFWGDDASRQPGKCGDMMLHETVVGWIRFCERRSLPKKPWEETEEQFEARLRGIAQKINTEYNLEGLCRELPERVDKLVDAEGEKIGK